jgi:hypothetical protein
MCVINTLRGSCTYLWSAGGKKKARASDRKGKEEAWRG